MPRQTRYRQTRYRQGARNVFSFRPRRKSADITRYLVAIAAVTMMVIGGMYLYYRADSPRAGGPAVTLAGADVFTCHVASITDGDTLRCLDGTRVRLNAVAAREVDGSCTPGHPCPQASAQEATDELTMLAAGQTLQCRQTGTTYGRKAAICVNESGTEINCAMVRSGKALIWPRYAAENPICVY